MTQKMPPDLVQSKLPDSPPISSLSNAEDFGIQSDVPVLQTVLRFFAQLVFFIGDLSRPIRPHLWALVVAVVVSSQLRGFLASLYSQVALIAALTFLQLALLQPLASWIARATTRLSLGPPIFGYLGGLPRIMVRRALLASAFYRIDFEEDDLQAVRRWVQLDNTLLERLLQTRFAKEPRLAGLEWGQFWNKAMRALGLGHTDIRALPAERAFVFQGLLGGRLASIQELLSPLVWAYDIALLLLLPEVVAGEIAVRTLAQVGVALVVLMALFWHMSLAMRPVERKLQVPESGRKETEQHLTPDELKEMTVLEAQVLDTRDTRIEAGWFNELRDYQLRAFAHVYVDAFMVLVLLAVCAAVGALLEAGTVTWYARMAVGVAAFPMGMSVIFYVVTTLAQRAKSALVLIATGIIVGLVPLALGFLLGDEASIGVEELVQSAVTALIAIVGTLLTDHIREVAAERKTA